MSQPKQARIYFDCIPDEILYKIVSLLPGFDLCALAKVSRRLRRVCSDKRLWKRLSLDQQQIPISQMEMLLTSSFPVQEIDFTNSWIPDAQYHHSTISPNRHMTLEKLNLTDFGMWDQDGNNSNLLYMLKRFRTKELILDWDVLHLNNYRSIKAISKHENLEVLSMPKTYFVDVTSVDIQKLFNSCNRLKELNLNRSQLSLKEIRAFCDHIPETVEKVMLVDVTFHNNKIEWVRDVAHYALVVIAVEESYKVLFRRAKNLKYFGTISFFLEMPGIMHQMIQHQRLETLGFSVDEGFSHSRLVSVLEKLPPKLKKMDIFLKEWKFSEVEYDSVLDELENLEEELISIDIEVHETDDD